MSYYVTTPIYYVNAEPHLGHAYSTIAADVLARHMRQRGEDVFFLTGTDEHGEPVELAAEREGIAPQELADRNAPRFEELMPSRSTPRTTSSSAPPIPGTPSGSQRSMQRVHDNGHVYEGVYEGWYCPRCADFYSRARARAREHLPDPRDPARARARGELVLSPLGVRGRRCERLYAERPDFVVPEHRRNEALSFIEQGLEDVSLSRPKLKWGMPLPWDPSQRMYVWFDALLNYYTALSFARDGEDLTERFWPANRPRASARTSSSSTPSIWPALSDRCRDRAAARDGRSTGSC